MLAAGSGPPSNKALQLRASDQSHLGTPYSGLRMDLYAIFCFGKTLPRDPSVLILTPIALFHLVDLPFSTIADTLLLPVDIPLEPDARSVVPGCGSCKTLSLQSEVSGVHRA